jgi:membrane associated rhomboid family serine protease
MFPIGDDNSSRKRVPVVTYVLVALNILVFFVELIAGDVFIVTWSFVPSRFLASPASESVTIFTSMFMHGGWLHIAGNMLYLWIFGDNVEDRFGHLRYLGFYVVCGVVALFTQLAFSLESSIPILGASGAIAGVLGAYVLLFPRRRVIVLLGFLVVPMPALAVIGFWMVLQFFNGIGSIIYSADTGGIAVMAHIGGFVAGVVLAVLMRGKRVA